jgi:hypothetical protein
MNLQQQVTDFPIFLKFFPVTKVLGIKVNCVVKLHRFNVKTVSPQYRIGNFSFDIQLTEFSNVTAVADEVGSVIPSIIFS